MGSKEFRESKQAQGRSSEEEKVRENLLLFKKRRMAEKVLTFNKEAEDKLAAGEKISQALKQCQWLFAPVLARARTAPACCAA